jgi:hypothetical protein
MLLLVSILLVLVFLLLLAFLLLLSPVSDSVIDAAGLPAL